MTGRSVNTHATTDAEIVLAVDGLVKRYGDLVAVEDLSFDVRAGEVFGFLGPNGAGKTTAISMICGLLAPDAGRVLVHGRLMTAGAGTRSSIGVCPQDVVIWERLTCLEQLEFVGEMYAVPRAEARRRGRELLETLGLTEKAGALAATLSGGMKRRLNLALALVHDPDVVVLDEPEAGLDPQSRITVREFIRSLARRKTVVLTTHNMDEAERLADRVAIIDHGRLLVLDTPEGLKRRVGEGDLIEIGLAADDDPGRAEAALAGLTSVAVVRVTANVATLRSRDALSHLGDALNALRAAGVPVGDVRLRSASLEDVFVALTGRGLRS
ncbi:MAG TPA: ABC transporter ATP-binding protein [Vicinamibacterales bacterium]|jgi:ABC-2 type transport system ATP-binding protein